jgi:uncharacterized membrane protein YphA (DoxX/SURF4 family)
VALASSGIPFTELALAGRWVVGLILLKAGFGKLFAGSASRQSAVANYQLLPKSLVVYAAVLVPWTEILLAALLLSGIVLVPAAAATTMLLAAFALAVAINLVRGRRINCGCGGAPERPIGWRLVSQDLILCGISLCLCATRIDALAFWAGPGTRSTTDSALDLLPVPMIILLWFIASVPVARASRIGRGLAHVTVGQR